MPHTPGALKQTRVSVTDSLKRRELSEEFLFWYFDGFLIPLLKVGFSCPECRETGMLMRLHADHILRDRVFCVPEQSAVLPARRLAHTVYAASAEAEHGHVQTRRPSTWWPGPLCERRPILILTGPPSSRRRKFCGSGGWVSLSCACCRRRRAYGQSLTCGDESRR